MVNNLSRVQLGAPKDERTNGAEAAILRFILQLTLELLNNILMRGWLNPRDKSLNYELIWRPRQVQDVRGNNIPDTSQRLIRWDRRAPNWVFRDGFLPIVTQGPNADQSNLAKYVNGHKSSIFLSTTQPKEAIEDGRYKCYVWQTRSAERGIQYRYEIFAPGGLDVNKSLKKSEKDVFSEENEICFPGGIRREFIRSAREYHNGRVVRIWINPNFQNDNIESLPPIEAVESTSTAPTPQQIEWSENHPDGGNQEHMVPDIPKPESLTYLIAADNDKKSKSKFDPDEGMKGYGYLKEDCWISNQTKFEGVYSIRSAVDTRKAIWIRDDKCVIKQFDPNDKYQKLIAIYNEKTSCGSNNNYTLRNYGIDTYIVTWMDYQDPKSTSLNMVFQETTIKLTYASWLIKMNDDASFTIKSYVDNNQVVDLYYSKTEDGTKVQVWPNNNTSNQKWFMTPLFANVPVGKHIIKTTEPNNINQCIYCDTDKKGVYIKDYNKSFVQEWNFIFDSNKKAYKIKCDWVGINGKVLTWDYNDTKKLIVMEDKNEEQQFWYFQNYNGNKFIIRNCYDPSLIITQNNNEPVTVQKYRSNFIGQLWYIPCDTYKTVVSDSYIIKSKINSNIVIGAPYKLNGVTSPETQLVSYSQYQTWNLNYLPEQNSYLIMNSKYKEYCLVLKYETKDLYIDKYIDTHDLNKNRLQYWIIDSTSRPGGLIIRNALYPDLVISVETDEPGKQIKSMKTFSLNSMNQVLELVACHQDVLDGHYTIKLFSNLKYVMSMDDTFLKLNANKYENSQIWQITYNAEYNAYKLNAIVAEDSAITVVDDGKSFKIEVALFNDLSNQYWTIIREDEKYRFVNFAYTDIEIGLDKDNNIVPIYRSNKDPVTNWVLNTNIGIEDIDTMVNITSFIDYKKLLSIDSSQDAILTQFNNILKTKFVMQYDFFMSGYVIYIEQLNSYSMDALYYQGKDMPVKLGPYSGPDKRYVWNIEYNPFKGAYKIRNLYDPECVLDLKDSVTSEGNSIITYTENNNSTPNQLWNIVPINGIYYTTDDAFVRDGEYASQNYGSSDALSIKNETEDYNRMAYIKFNFWDIDEPVSKASIRLFLIGIDSDFKGVMKHEVYLADYNWNESTITWNNKPKMNEKIADLNLPQQGYVTFDVTKQVNDAFKKDKVLSIAIKSAKNYGKFGYSSYYSKETALDAIHYPVMVVDYNTK